MPPGLHRDEANNLAASWRLTQGYGLPLFFEDRPEPFDVIVRAGFLRLTGVRPFTARVFSVLLSLLGVAATAAAARALFRDHPRRAIIALTAAVTVAAVPAWVVMGRGFYRTHWIPLATMLALAALAWGWRTGKRRYYALAGFFTGLGALFYMAGLAFPLAVILIVLINAALRRATWPGWRNLSAMALAGGVAMLPWFYLYLRIPNWLGARLVDASRETVNPLADLPGFLAHAWRAVTPIYRADTFFDPRYNTYTTAFLNPALLALCLAGLGVALWRWRRPGMLAPVIAGTVMLLPGALAGEPEHAVRLTGVFGPLALLTGLGAGALLAWLSTRTALVRRLAWMTLALILVFSPLYTFAHVRYHFTAQPRLFADPTGWLSAAQWFRLGYQDLLAYVAASEEPIYIPIEHLNHENAVAWLRPAAFPTVRAWAGEPLPSGEILLPVNDVYGILPTAEPVQYALALPDAGEIVILPPLPPDEATILKGRILADGSPVINAQGWTLGQALPVTADANPFAGVRHEAPGVLGVFDDELELVGFDAPRPMTPGAWIPVTLSWRLRAPTGQDYFAFVQPMDSSGVSRGSHDGAIQRFIYPTVMWEPGEVVSETRWFQLHPDAPPGGYRFAVSVYTHPGPVRAAIVDGMGDALPGDWLLVGRSAVSLPEFPEPPADARSVDAVLGEVIRLRHALFTPPLGALRPGETLTVRLYWEALVPPPEDYTIFLHLKANDGTLLAQQDAQPLDGLYPTGTWVTGERVVTTHALAVPADGPAPAALSVGLYRWPSLERLPVVQGGVPLADGLITLE